MDPSRQIRLIIPPFFLFISLISAFFFKDFDSSVQWLKNDNIHLIANIASLIVIATLPVGFLLSTLTIFIMRVITLIFGCRNYDLFITTDDIEQITKDFDSSLAEYVKSKINNRIWCAKRRPSDVLRYSTTIFDHGVIRGKWPGVHEWISRTFSIFMVSAISLFSVLLSILLILILKIKTHSIWYMINFSFSIILAISAWWGRRETSKMINLLIHGKYT